MSKDFLTHRHFQRGDIIIEIPFYHPSAFYLLVYRFFFKVSPLKVHNGIASDGSLHGKYICALKWACIYSNSSHLCVNVEYETKSSIFKSGNWIRCNRTHCPHVRSCLLTWVLVCSVKMLIAITLQDQHHRDIVIVPIKCYLLSWQVREAGFPVTGGRTHAVSSNKQDVDPWWQRQGEERPK